ncbi:hypothetical protein P170DRAFT_356261 [Aspergillus steynii IBT 23096]|uniref:Ubiquitin fusion degradation protein n=1 Tax=Aspergillus steynii IBT 23096 TaxID=1392250 RepID=A0A2I2GCC6_9EURO|nr:uncharacterized protein P170DRAFT_356261 [Aspergillus steynii IBT 23096]PLB50533.1 hypothetical protein P170DRAFT_356261 [Aspergillus steynii IBT 23096]
MPTSGGELWSSVATTIDSGDIKAMPVVLQSTINLLETELAKARAALKDIQPNPTPVLVQGDEIAVGAVAAYRQNLIGRPPEFFYGSRRLSPKEVGLVPVVREVSPDEDDAASQEPCAQGFNTISVAPRRRTSLVDVLSNSLILDHMAPYLSASSLFALASTSRFLQATILETPYVFRHLNLSHSRGAHPPAKDAIDSEFHRSGHADDGLTEDDFYSASLRHVFANLERRSILQDVRTLVLDGLAVPADLVAEIILNERFHVRILSIRDCRHLNERKLMQVLQYAVRPSRPRGAPRIKGIYHFTPMNHARAMVRSRYRDWWGSRCAGQAPCGATAAKNPVSPHDQQPGGPQCCQNAWYRPSGRLFQRSIEDGWAQTIQRCEGVIAFDAVLCRGPRHDVELSTPSTGSQGEPQRDNRLVLGPAIATVALGPDGCDGCHTSPEGPSIWGRSPPEQFPLLTPPPLHSSSIAVAKRPALFPHEHPAMIVRCAGCLNDRWCHRCNKWFCTSCLPHPERVRSNLSPHQTAVRGRDNNRGADSIGPGVSKDCWECGPTCAACKVDCQRMCQNCRGDYCIEHNEGCSATMCDWCNTSTRHRMREIC